MQGYLERCQEKGVDRTRPPFGIPKYKIELMFLKIDCLEAYIRDSPHEAGLTAEPVTEPVKETKSLLSERQKAIGVAKVLRILEADSTALDSRDLADLCRVEK